MIDQLGVVYDDKGNAIGTYDPDTNKCEGLDGKLIDCGQSEKPPQSQIQTPTIKSKPTYLWVGFIAAALLAAGVVGWWLYHRKYTKSKFF